LTKTELPLQQLKKFTNTTNQAGVCSSKPVMEISICCLP